MFAVVEPVDTQPPGPSMAELAQLRAEILAAAARHGASNVRVFGSVARGEADAASDVDFLVDFEPGRSLLDLAGLLYGSRWVAGICLSLTLTSPFLAVLIYLARRLGPNTMFR